MYIIRLVCDLLRKSLVLFQAKGNPDCINDPENSVDPEAGSRAELSPGAEGDPLPSGVWVIKLAQVPMDFPEYPAVGKANPVMFALSTTDRSAEVPRLSVYAERLTTPEQLWDLLGRNPKYRLVLRLNVDDIRAIPPQPDTPGVPPLDVQWDPKQVVSEGGEEILDTRPGAAGHAGIVGLMAGRGSLVRKDHTNNFRLKLADLADVRWLECNPRGNEDDGID